MKKWRSDSSEIAQPVGITAREMARCISISENGTSVERIHLFSRKAAFF